MPFTSETGRIAALAGVEKREGPARRDLPADFLGHLPLSLSRASSDLLPRILSNEIDFRSSILDRIAIMEGHIVKALEKGLYKVDLASMPTLLREWRQCLEMSLRIVEKTKGLSTGDAAVNQVSGLLAKEAILRKELDRLGIVDSSGRILRPVEHQEPETAQEAPGATISAPAIAEAGSPPDRAAGRQAGGKAKARATGRKRKRRGKQAGGMTTGSLSGRRTGDRQVASGAPSSPPPESLVSSDVVVPGSIAVSVPSQESQRSEEESHES